MALEYLTALVVWLLAMAEVDVICSCLRTSDAYFDSLLNSTITGMMRFFCKINCERQVRARVVNTAFRTEIACTGYGECGNG